MPILDAIQRMYEIGRIRTGTRNNAGHPEKLSTFRLTSRNRQVIEAAAKLYGGEPGPCDPKGKLKGHWEVTITADELPCVMSPMEPTSWMEQWGSNKVCKRRCDRHTETISGKPCICAAVDKMDCKPTTRICVILHELPGVGVWRLESHGWGAAEQLLQTATWLRQQGATGMHVQCSLALEEYAKENKVWYEPVLRVPYTPAELAAGYAAPALAEGPPALQPTRTMTPKAMYVQKHAAMGLPDEASLCYPVWSRWLGRDVGPGTEPLTDTEWLQLHDGLLDMDETGDWPPEWTDNREHDFSPAEGQQ